MTKGDGVKADKAILCVDDEAIIVFALKQELRARYSDRFLCESALSAAEALETIGSLEADGIELVLVISDWLMPGMKGDELLRSIKERHPGARALLVTGQADEELVAGLLRDGVANDVLSKPWRDAELLELVRRCVGC